MRYIEEFWDNQILPTLMEYIKIPNKSPHFDKNWAQNGFMDQAVKLITEWCQHHAVPNMSTEVIRLPGRTPVIFIDIPGSNQETILLYGHLDKQPEMTGWDSDLHPFKPALKGDKLYGRGAADDGYAVFAALLAIKSLQKDNIPHARCVILIETCEESGSYDLPYYIDALAVQIGNPSLIICLDSCCGNYEQLWATTSLRGLINGTLTIEVLKEGVHSGASGGIVPSCFRILRILLDRIENKQTGEIILSDLHVTIPEERKQQAEHAAAILGTHIFSEYPFIEGAEPDSGSLTELILRRNWKPTLSITGCNGMPLIENAGNVTLPNLSVKLSFRLPPTCDPEKAGHLVKEALEKDPPFQAKVTFHVETNGAGWNAPPTAPWLQKAINDASLAYFNNEAVPIGEGVSIPFVGMLGEKFGQAQFLVTGVLGPHSNAHGPNEFLHLTAAKKLTACIAKVIQDHYLTLEQESF